MVPARAPILPVGQGVFDFCGGKVHVCSTFCPLARAVIMSFNPHRRDRLGSKPWSIPANRTLGRCGREELLRLLGTMHLCGWCFRKSQSGLWQWRRDIRHCLTILCYLRFLFWFHRFFWSRLRFLTTVYQTAGPNRLILISCMLP